MQFFIKVTKGFLKFQNYLFPRCIFCLTPNIFKTFQECKHYADTNISLNEV